MYCAINSSFLPFFHNNEHEYEHKSYSTVSSTSRNFFYQIMKNESGSVWKLNSIEYDGFRFCQKGTWAFLNLSLLVNSFTIFSQSNLSLPPEYISFMPGIH